MLMLDLCAGLCGASQAMLVRGWDVLTLDNDPRFGCSVTADLRTWHYDGPRPDLLWISPPCVEFARESMPWSRTGKAPDMSIVQAARRLIDEIQPRYWAVENVRGAVRFFAPLFGQPRLIVGPFFLWGNFPPLDGLRVKMKAKESYSSTQRAERAKVPAALSEALAIAIEQQHRMWEAA